MKVRVTLMTENDKHFDCSEEEAELRAHIGWQYIVGLLNNAATDPSEKAMLEKVEVVEM